jgi:GT2 family glycosyltransferase
VPYEIIVVDGGSTDQTPQWLVTQPDILTIVHHNRPNGQRLRSWGWFMNVGFRAAHGRCILMMSDDSVLVHGAVEAGLARVAKAEKAGRVIGGVAFYFRNWPLERNYFVQKTIGGMLMVNHGIFLREALEAVGFCEEEAYGFYKCDSDLALKLWRAGYDIVDCPNAFVEHLMLPDEEIRLQNKAMMERDREVLLDRWDGIYTHRLFTEMFNRPSRVEKAFEDPWNTAEALREFTIPSSRRPSAKD